MLIGFGRVNFGMFSQTVLVAEMRALFVFKGNEKGRVITLNLQCCCETIGVARDKEQTRDFG
jgi:hypothetical protein